MEDYVLLKFPNVSVREYGLHVHTNKMVTWCLEYDARQLNKDTNCYWLLESE